MPFQCRPRLLHAHTVAAPCNPVVTGEPVFLMSPPTQGVVYSCEVVQPACLPVYQGAVVESRPKYPEKLDERNLLRAELRPESTIDGYHPLVLEFRLPQSENPQFVFAGEHYSPFSSNGRASVVVSTYSGVSIPEGNTIGGDAQITVTKAERSKDGEVIYKVYFRDCSQAGMQGCLEKKDVVVRTSDGVQHLLKINGNKLENAAKAEPPPAVVIVPAPQKEPELSAKIPVQMPPPPADPIPPISPEKKPPPPPQVATPAAVAPKYEISEAQRQRLVRLMQIECLSTLKLFRGLDSAPGKGGEDLDVPLRAKTLRSELRVLSDLAVLFPKSEGPLGAELATALQELETGATSEAAKKDPRKFLNDKIDALIGILNKQLDDGKPVPRVDLKKDEAFVDALVSRANETNAKCFELKDKKHFLKLLDDATERERQFEKAAADKKNEVPALTVVPEPPGKQAGPLENLPPLPLPPPPAVSPMPGEKSAAPVVPPSQPPVVPDEKKPEPPKAPPPLPTVTTKFGGLKHYTKPPEIPADKPTLRARFLPIVSHPAISDSPDAKKMADECEAVFKQSDVAKLPEGRWYNRPQHLAHQLMICKIDENTFAVDVLSGGVCVRDSVSAKRQTIRAYFRKPSGGGNWEVAAGYVNDDGTFQHFDDTLKGGENNLTTTWLQRLQMAGNSNNKLSPFGDKLELAPALGKPIETGLQTNCLHTGNPWKKNDWSWVSKLSRPLTTDEMNWIENYLREAVPKGSFEKTQSSSGETERLIVDFSIQKNGSFSENGLFDRLGGVARVRVWIEPEYGVFYWTDAKATKPGEFLDKGLWRRLGERFSGEDPATQSIPGGMSRLSQSLESFFEPRPK